jgi:lipopolysaccharide kinase (Kdo/WaaP) family protein
MVTRRQDLDRDGLDACLLTAGQPIEGLRVLKRGTKSSVMAGLVISGRAVCLKSYLSVRRGRRAFENMVKLESAGVPIPAPLFIWERSRKHGGGAVVGMEDLAPRPELDRWLSGRIDAWRSSGGGRQELRALLRPVFLGLGAAVRELHARRIVLDDLKTCNIILADEPEAFPERAFRFIDLDGVTVGRRVTLLQRAKSLCQVNRSTPVEAGIGARRDFWREYARDLSPRDRRWIRRRAIELSGKRPVIYVTWTGDREEPWPRSARDWPR